MNSTRRNVFHRASSAAIDDATPTFSSSVNSKSCMRIPVSMKYQERSQEWLCYGPANVEFTLANHRRNVKPRAPARQGACFR